MAAGVFTSPSLHDACAWHFGISDKDLNGVVVRRITWGGMIAKMTRASAWASLIASKPKRRNVKLSFSQCGEDLIIRHLFNGLGINTPSYLDVGAHHPYHLSNTAHFYLTGSRGINVEPDPELFSLFQTERPSDVNLNVGIAATPGEQDFFVMAPRALSSFCRPEIERILDHYPDHRMVEVRKVRVETINHILSKHCADQFPQLLSVDVEGADRMILEFLDLQQDGPMVICIETISYSRRGDGEKDRELISLIEKQGYLNYADTNINTILVRKNLWCNRTRCSPVRSLSKQHEPTKVESTSR